MYNYIKMCEQAEEIQKAWKKKKSHIEDKIYIKESDEFLLITKEFEYEYDGGTEYFIFQRAKNPPEPIPFIKWSKEAFYKYDDGELNIIHLPTQGQLQEMVSCNWHDVFCKILWWHSDDDKSSEEFKSMFTSMNEVWLAFVMKEKYHKIWTGKDWVNV